MNDFFKGLWRVIWIGMVSFFIGYSSFLLCRMFDDIHIIALKIEEQK